MHPRGSEQNIPMTVCWNMLFSMENTLRSTMTYVCQCLTLSRYADIVDRPMNSWEDYRRTYTTFQLVRDNRSSLVQFSFQVYHGILSDSDKIDMANWFYDQPGACFFHCVNPGCHSLSDPSDNASTTSKRRGRPYLGLQQNLTYVLFD